jgi:hypothetical protein
MGRKLIYYCDSCSNVLSDGEIEKKHISINLGRNSGWVKPAKIKGYWEHVSKAQGIYQFCNPKCLADYFKKLSK